MLARAGPGMLPELLQVPHEDGAAGFPMVGRRPIVPIGVVVASLAAPEAIAAPKRPGFLRAAFAIHRLPIEARFPAEA